jgi:hypothetical protein
VSGAPPRSGNRPAIAAVDDLWATTVAVRFEFIWTILLDMGVVLTAIFARFIILLALTLLGHEGGRSWGITALEWVSDLGIVSAAALFTLFDVAKRALVGWQQLAGQARAGRQR